MKRFIYLFLIVCCSCSTNLSFDFPENEKMVFCNCLFSPDTVWTVQVGYTYTFNQPTYDNWIGDAKVFIVDEKQDTVHLSHIRKGKYQSINEKPQEGIKYRLFVVNRGDTLSSSESSVPVAVNFDLVEFDKNPGQIRIDYYTMDEVYALKFKLDFQAQKEQAVMVRAFIFDSIEGLGYYTFNDAVYDSLFRTFGDSLVINKLLCLNGDTIYGLFNNTAIVTNLLAKDFNLSTIDKVVSASFSGKEYQKREKTFQRIDCFSGTQNFKKFDFEGYTQLGMFQKPSTFDLYVWDFIEGEYWIECKALSPEAYRYYIEYITQISSRADYNNIQYPVYSNINNGLGIFAGYSKTMIRIE